MDQSYDFPSAYADSRNSFRTAAERLGFELESYSIGLQGPDGEDLAIDVAISPNATAQKGLVLSSGLHGVEGFFGAAVQQRFLNQWTNSPNIKSVLIHGINPYGFAWIRRFNEANVDLNRNFLLAGEEYSGAPDGYRELDSFLNPRRAPSRWELFWPKALLLLARHGLASLQKAIAAGQYEYPQGIFFGGNGIARSNEILRGNLMRWVDGCERVVHLDFHTGLGRSGTWKLLIDYPLSDSQLEFLTKWIGREFFEAYDAQDRSYDARGGLGEWCSEQGLAPDYLFACAEFGTHDPVTVLRALREENQAHFFGERDSASSIRAKQKLLEAFCPQSPAWRRQVILAADQLTSNAMKGLIED
jgi:hypothetical protein